MKIISFDSGLERTGWAVFDADGHTQDLLEFGCIFTPKTEPIQNRIHLLGNDVRQLVAKYEPSIFVLEQIFFLVNKKTAIQVAQAQGVVMSIAGEFGMQVDFMTPTHIKQALTGYGLSDKKNVQKMVQLLLHLDPMPTQDDTVDAIACGLTYCTMMKPV